MVGEINGPILDLVLFKMVLICVCSVDVYPVPYSFIIKAGSQMVCVKSHSSAYVFIFIFIFFLVSPC